MVRQAPSESRKPIYELVRDHVLEMIRNGEMRVGDKLPSERKLAETFGASRNSVREAIKVLAENKIVQSRQGDGTFICSDHEAIRDNPVVTAVEKHRKRLKEVFEFRRILEPRIAFLAASNITSREIDSLKLLVFDQERRIIVGEGDSDLDNDFHLLVARCTRNSVIVEVLKSLNHILMESRSKSAQTEERRIVSLRTHILIVDALEKRDPEAAMQAMLAHLSEVELLALETEENI